MNNHSRFFIHLEDGPNPNNRSNPNNFELHTHTHPLHLLSQAFSRFSNLVLDSFARFSAAPHNQTNSHVSNPFLFKHLALAQLDLSGPDFSKPQSLVAFLCHAFSTFSIKHRPDHVQSLPVLSLASSLLPPLDNLASNMLAVPRADKPAQMDQIPCDVQQRGCLAHSFPDFNWIRSAVEPITGIEFPRVLNNILAKQNQSSLSSEVLVGTGSRTVTIIKIKSLKVYAFGFYVHPYSICQKLGSKYSSKSAVELSDHNDFYADLLREDIGMTVRLVVNCNGMKINAVKDAFEKSLRDRLVKTNPETDFKCITTFSSFFTKDIPLPVGTIIDFRRTADGQLITEVGGNQIGAVHSRELCRAFFDMYLGEVPVSKQTKEEIGSNVASIVRRC